MIESYYGVYSKRKLFNLFNTWYFGVGLDKYKYADKDPTKHLVAIKRYPEIVYIGFRLKKHMYDLSFRFGKYDKSICSNG